jgi:hypothetical protein
MISVTTDISALQAATRRDLETVLESAKAATDA